MNIGVLMYGYLPKIGGAQISAHNLAHALTNQGHRVTVFADSTLLKQAESMGWNFNYSVNGVGMLPFRVANHGGMLGRWAGAAMIARQIRKNRIETLFVVGLWPWGLLLDELKTLTRTKVAIRAAGDDIQVDESIGYGVGLDSARRSKMLKGAGAADVAIAISETVVNEYNSSGANLRRIEIIPPGVDLDAFESRPTNRAQVLSLHKIPTDRNIIISVGRNHPKKGFSDLVNALEMLTANGGNHHLVIVGDRSDELIPLARELGVADRFTPIPIIASQNGSTMGTFPSADLIDLYKASDVFVLPSHLETYANVAVEAMAAGIPAIVTDAPGCIDTLTHEIDGLIVATGNPSAIAAAIKRLIDDDQLASTIVEAGSKRAAEQSWQEVATNYFATVAK
jgi:glycosyltransferase involved in cell wall biosynthesis